MMRSLLPVQIQGVWFALEALHIQEILGPRPWTGLSGGGAERPGVLAWRGRAIVLVDLAALVGASTTLRPAEIREKTLIAQVSGFTFGLPVDGLNDLQHVAEESVQPVHATRQRHATGEVQLLGVTMPVIDLAVAVRGLVSDDARTG